jgi:hypothetical protein
MGIVDRLRRLEASLTPEASLDPADAAARDRFVAKLAQMAERYRAAREREEGLQPDLGELSYASLLALVMSYPYGEVPPEVESALWASAETYSHGPHSVFAKVAKLCLESRGAG